MRIGSFVIALGAFIAAPAVVHAQELYERHDDGVDALEDERYEEAIALLAEAVALLEEELRKDPDFERCPRVGLFTECYIPYYWLATAYFRSGDCIEAIRAYSRLHRPTLKFFEGTRKGRNEQPISKARKNRIACLDRILRLATDRETQVNTVAAEVQSLKDRPDLAAEWDDLGLGRKTDAAEDERDAMRRKLEEAEQAPDPFAALEPALVHADRALELYGEVKDTAESRLGRLVEERRQAFSSAQQAVADAAGIAERVDELARAPELSEEWPVRPELGPAKRRADERLADARAGLAQVSPGFENPDDMASIQSALGEAEDARERYSMVEAQAHERIGEARRARVADASNIVLAAESEIGRLPEILNRLRPELQRSNPELEDTAAQARQAATTARERLDEALPNPEAAAAWGLAEEAIRLAERAREDVETVRIAADRVSEEHRRALELAQQTAEQAVEAATGALAAVEGRPSDASFWTRHEDLQGEKQRLDSRLERIRSRIESPLEDLTLNELEQVAGDARQLREDALALDKLVPERIEEDRDKAAEEAAAEELRRLRAAVVEAIELAEGNARDADQRADALRGKLGDDEFEEIWSTDPTLGDAREAAQQDLDAARRDRSADDTARLESARNAALDAAATFADLMERLDRIPFPPPELRDAWDAWEEGANRRVIELLPIDFSTQEHRLERHALRAYAFWELRLEANEEANLGAARSEILRCLDINDEYEPPEKLGQPFRDFWDEVRRGEMLG